MSLSGPIADASGRIVNVIFCNLSWRDELVLNHLAWPPVVAGLYRGFDCQELQWLQRLEFD